ncbi:MAG: sugar transferase [Acidimicrobiia bacterium]
MKRALDVTLSVIALLVLSPVLAVVAGLVWWKLGRPILFTQERPGLEGRPFTLVKFRTMAPTTEEAQDGSSDEQRLGAFGASLRSTSLDELPELWNVLKGDMSLVGPRPLLMQYLPLYSPRQSLRHQVKPGITGWAQINGRNATPWHDRLEMDAWYAENHTLWLDLKILALTIPRALRREDVAQEGRATVDYFTGSES